MGGADEIVDCAGPGSAGYSKDHGVTVWRRPRRQTEGHGAAMTVGARALFGGIPAWVPDCRHGSDIQLLDQQ